jgi:hypothetical protein
VRKRSKSMFGPNLSQQNQQSTASPQACKAHASGAHGKGKTLTSRPPVPQLMRTPPTPQQNIEDGNDNDRHERVIRCLHLYPETLG